MGRIPVKEKLAELEEQGKRLRRRQDYLRQEADFLAEMMFRKPYAEMAAHRRLLQEWEEEIGRLEQSLQYLRDEYRRISSKAGPKAGK